jgi:hypothetical protein
VGNGRTARLPVAEILVALTLLSSACAGDTVPSDDATDTTTDTTTADAADTDLTDTDTDGDIIDAVTADADTDTTIADTTDTDTTSSCVRFDPGAADPEAALFDPGCVVDVAITIPFGDWDALRHETRNVIDVVGGDCMAGPRPDIFDWYAADVTIGGQVVRGAGLRKKGFLGSLDVDRPSLKIEFDRFVPGQKLVGVERLTLNNMRQDPGIINSCLAYGLMTQMGIAAPRCAFARVRVNTFDLGVYAHVEAIKKPFLRRHFGSDDGNLYEGTISDFRDGFLATWEPKNNEDDLDRSALERVATALDAPDDALMDALDAVIDLDGFLTFWAAEVLLGHWDGYAGNINNTFVYVDPSDGRLRFIPWGADALFTAPANLTDAPASVLARGALANRLYAHPTGRAAYHAKLRKLLAEAWDESAIAAEIDRMAALVGAELPPSTQSAFALAIESKKVWVEDRRAAIEAELANGGPAWTLGLAEALCWPETGTITGHFDTVWGTTNAQWPGGGVGALTVVVNGVTLEVGNVRANAHDGNTADTEGEAVLELIGQAPDGSYVIAQLIGPLDAVQAGPTVPIDWRTFRGWVARARVFDDESFELLGAMSAGELHFDVASTWSNEVIRGRFSATLLDTTP